jgi:hypothetical protein
LMRPVANRRHPTRRHSTPASSRRAAATISTQVSTTPRSSVALRSIPRPAPTQAVPNRAVSIRPALIHSGPTVRVPTRCVPMACVLTRCVPMVRVRARLVRTAPARVSTLPEAPGPETRALTPQRLLFRPWPDLRSHQPPVLGNRRPVRRGRRHLDLTGRPPARFRASRGLRQVVPLAPRDAPTATLTSTRMRKLRVAGPHMVAVPPAAVAADRSTGEAARAAAATGSWSSSAARPASSSWR